MLWIIRRLFGALFFFFLPAEQNGGFTHRGHLRICVSKIHLPGAKLNKPSPTSLYGGEFYFAIFKLKLELLRPVSCVQTWYYFTHYSNDAFYIKCLVRFCSQLQQTAKGTHSSYPR